MSPLPIRPRTALRALVTASLLLAPGLQVRLPAQELGTKEWRSALTDLVQDKQDGRAAEEIAKLAKGFADLEEKVQKDCLKQLYRYVKVRRDEEDDVLHVALMEGLGSMGEEGLKTLRKSVRLDRIKDRPKALAAAVASIGTFRDKKDVDLLCDFLLHKDTPVIEAAIVALGTYTHTDRLRKEVFDQLLQTYQSVYAQSLPTPNRDREQGQPVRRPDEKKLKALEGAFEKALSNLSLETQTRGSRSWQNWYTDNKRRRWADDEEDR